MDFPRFSERLARLLYPETLSFLLGLSLVLVALSVLVRLQATYRCDLAVTRGLQEWNPPLATALFRALTFLANGRTMVALAAITVVVGYVAGWMVPALFVLVTLLAAPLNIALKAMFDRPRPQPAEVRVAEGAHAFGTSYPSGPSMLGTAFYGFLAVLVNLHVPTPGWREGLMALLILLPVGIGLSRVYLGAHWLSDVVGGWTAGVLVVALTSVMYRG